MPSSTEVNKIIDVDRSSIQILLAESNPFEADRIRLNVDQEFQAGIRIAKTYDELIVRITQDSPQLLLLGKIDRFNYFDICKDCHKVMAELLIFLLSREETISGSFVKLAKTRGITDIIEPDPVALNSLFRTIDRPITHQHQISEPSLGLPIIGSTMLAWLEEIIAISNNYFGPLAQGNYWRKSQAQIIDEFPLMSNWSVDHFSKISCNESILNQDLTDADIQGLQAWIRMFIQECERIITDYRSILTNSNLSLLAKDLFIKF